MRRYIRSVALLLALLGGAWLTWRFLGGSSKRTAPKGSTTSTTVAEHAEPAPVASPEAKRSRDAEAAVNDASRPESPPFFPATRRSGNFVAEIVDAYGASVAGARVKIDSRIGGHFGDLAIADDRDVYRELRTDHGGRVEIAALAEGAYSITARADDGRAAREYFDFSLALADHPLCITLSECPQRPPGIAITVVGRDGAIVANAEVELFGAVLDRGLFGAPSHPSLTARSDVNGVARFDGVRWVAGMAVGKAPDGRVGAVAFGDVDPKDRMESCPEQEQLVPLPGESDDAGESPTEKLLDKIDSLSGAFGLEEGRAPHPTAEDFVAARIVVAPPGGISGTIDFTPDTVDPDGALAGATIEAWLGALQIPWESSHGRGTTVRVDGRKFALDGLPSGTYSLVLHSPGGTRLALDRAEDNGAKLENSVAPPIVKVEQGATAQVTLHATIGGTIHGRVHLADGSPVADARVVATYAPWRGDSGDAFVRQQMHIWSFSPDSGLEGLHPLTHFVARTDARGEYRLAGLQPGFHRVMVTARGLCFDRRDWTKVADAQVVELDHELEAAGALQGIAPGWNLLGVTRVGAKRPDAIAKLFEGRSFTFGGLRPGTYILADFTEERAVPPVERGRATVEAGRTTFVDLTDAPGPFEIAGQVVDAHGGVPSAIVEFESVRRHVDAAGSFVFHSSRPIDGTLMIGVETEQLSELFACEVDGKSGGWRRSLRLGDESLRIEVRDSRGNPLVGCVQLGNAKVPSVPSSPVRIRTKVLPLDGIGSLTIEHLAAGRYDLHVSAPGKILLATKVNVPRAGVLRVELADAGDVVVRLVSADEAPVRDWRVRAYTYLGEGDITAGFLRNDESFARRSAYSRRDGVARIAHVRSGKVVIEAQDLSFLDTDSPIVEPTTPTRTQIELRPGETKEVELRVPAGKGGGR